MIFMAPKKGKKPRKERRRGKRVSIPFDVTFRFGGAEHTAKTVDVSLHGFFARSDEPLPIGAMIPFTLKNRKMKSPLDIVGRVVHVATRKGEDTVGMGVEIRQIAPGHEAPFDQFRAIVENAIYAGEKK